jgi:hypothetical protein
MYIHVLLLELWVKNNRFVLHFTEILEAGALYVLLFSGTQQK